MAAANQGDDGDNDLSRVFARSLDLAQQMADTAPAGSLLVNEAAFGALSDPRGVVEFSKVERLYCWAWRADPAHTPAAPTETSPQPEAGDTPPPASPAGGANDTGRWAGGEAP